MARAGAGGPASRINRRFLMLALVSAALSAILVYVAISRSGGGGGEGESAATTAPVVVAAIDIPARTQITEDMVELRDVPISVRSSTALTDIDQALGEVSRYPIAADEQVTSLKVVSLGGTGETDALAFVVPKGMRGISIQADQVLSAGGLVLPGDYVDIIGVFDAKDEEGGVQQAYFVRTILQNVEVLAVAQTIADVPPGADEDGTAAAADAAADGQRARGSEAEPNPEATTLTLLVDPEQAEWVFLAEANGTLRAIVRGFGDSDTAEVAPILQTELFPPGFVPPSAGPAVPTETAPR